MLVFTFLINSLLADRVGKHTNDTASRSINPECPNDQAAVECEDDCFFEQYTCLSGCSSDDRDCITGCNREFTRVRNFSYQNFKLPSYYVSNDI